MCRLNPKVDFAFKKLFGSEENKDILISFINSVLQKEIPIKDIELKNPYNLASYKKDKMTILDIKAVDENEVWYDIEMQIGEQLLYDKRAVFYLSKTYVEQLESGNDFEKLRKTIGIHILNFDYIKEETYHNCYKMINVRTNKEFSDLLELHFIELSKFDREYKDYKDVKTALDRWVTFLNRAYEIDKNNIPEELAEESSINKAIEKLEIMYLEKEEREIYEGELKWLRVRNAELKWAETKGIEEGRAKGMKEGRAKGIEEGRAKGIEEGRAKGIEEGRQEGIEEGRQEGIEEGRQEGIEKAREQSRMKDVERVLKLLRKKFGDIDENISQRVTKLSNDKLSLIIEEILDISTLEDVIKYL